MFFHQNFQGDRCHRMVLGCLSPKLIIMDLEEICFQQDGIPLSKNTYMETYMYTYNLMNKLYII